LRRPVVKNVNAAGKFFPMWVNTAMPVSAGAVMLRWARALCDLRAGGRVRPAFVRKVRTL
jgi:hypothetical protein